MNDRTAKALTCAKYTAKHHGLKNKLRPLDRIQKQSYGPEGLIYYGHYNDATRPH